MIFDYLIAFYLCIICSYFGYQDIKTGIISNKYLVTFGLPLLVINWIYTCLCLSNLFPLILPTIGVCSILSLILYISRIWAGGDCKFFIMILLGFPYAIIKNVLYGINNIMLIPFLAFFIGYAFLIGQSIRQARKEKSKFSYSGMMKDIKNQLLRYLRSYLFLTLVNAVLSTVFATLPDFSYSHWILMIINVSILLIVSSQKFFNSYLFLFVTIIIDVWLGYYHSFYFINLRLIWICILISLMGLIRLLAQQFNHEKISIFDLRENMILSTSTSQFIANLPRASFTKISDETLRCRLNEDEVKTIKRLGKRKEPVKELLIVRKIPFGIYISLASILALIGGLFY